MSEKTVRIRRGGLWYRLYAEMKDDLHPLTGPREATLCSWCSLPILNLLFKLVICVIGVIVIPLVSVIGFIFRGEIVQWKRGPIPLHLRKGKKKIRWWEYRSLGSVPVPWLHFKAGRLTLGPWYPLLLILGCLASPLSPAFLQQSLLQSPMLKPVIYGLMNVTLIIAGTLMAVGAWYLLEYICKAGMRFLFRALRRIPSPAQIRKKLCFKIVFVDKP